MVIISDVRGKGLEVSRDVESVRRLGGRGARDSFVIGFFQDLGEKIKFPISVISVFHQKYLIKIYLNKSKRVDRQY